MVNNMKKQKVEVQTQEESKIKVPESVVFKSAVNWIALIIYIVIIAFSLFLCYLGFSQYIEESSMNTMKAFSFLYVIIGMVLGLYTIAALVRTFYKFEADGLYVRSGLMKNKIPYKAVVSLEKTHKLLTFNCLSTNKIRINYKDGNNSLKVHVSPKGEEEFIKELKKYCKSLKVEK